MQLAGSCGPENRSADDLLLNGFAPEWIGTETAAARRQLFSAQALWPILQIEDDQLLRTTQEALSHGAHRVGYFAYGQAELPSLDF